MVEGKNPLAPRVRGALLGLLAGALLLASGGCEPSEASPHESISTGAWEPGDPDQQVQVPPPELEEGVFPCSDCHDPDFLPPNPERREMIAAHQDIVLEHDEEHRWCLDCHDADDRDQLRLASGELVPFEESHRLCGQCHGDKYRDWRAGIHGRRSGQWDGEKSYLLCVHCHDSHSPAFDPMEPEPAPEPPERSR